MIWRFFNSDESLPGLEAVRRQDELADGPSVNSRRIPNRLQAHADVKGPLEWSFDAPKAD
jgi:hypothetical protein